MRWVKGALDSEDEAATRPMSTPPLRYGLAVLAAVLALLVSFALDPFVEPDPFPELFLAAVMVSAWYGGLGPGLLATGVSLLGAARLLFAPAITPTTTGVSMGLDLLTFLIAAVLISWLSAALRTARRQAEEATRRKTEFLAVLGHELRNPMGAITTAVRVLTEASVDGSREAKQREIIGRQTRRLSALVDDLLDVSRVVSGKILLERRPVDLADVARRCVESLEGTAARRHEIVLSVADEPLLVEADLTRLEQVVSNLLDNAVKYTPPHGRIVVTVARHGAEAVVRVTDSGIGIPNDMLPRIFEPFIQVSASLPRAGGGLGLGLALVRGLVELHGGSVTARSAGPDQGSEFEVCLPAIPETTVPALPLPGRDGPSPPAQPRHVLVVEDSADVRDALRALLEVWGHHVEVAEDGPVGVEMARLSRPEIALVDIGLPGFDGYQVAERLRAAPAGRGVFLVALSGYGQAEDRRRALAAGFDVHLLKPVDPEELARVLAEMPASGGASRS